ncbi:MAG: 50S ribosomal protein L30 [Eubacteriales bacterium]
MEKIKITLEKSLIGQKPNQKKTAASLGLSKIGDTIIHDSGCVIDGKIVVLSHLVRVEKVEH